MDTQKLLKKVGTHDGRFHADEVVATGILKEVFRIELIRSRDTKVLDKLDIVYDVGGGEFDHHGVDKVYREDGVPYAACGLIWKRFGKYAIKNRDGRLNEEEIDSIFNAIDKSFIEGIDAMDNGVRVDCGDISVMNFSSIISGFNPPWKSERDENEAFSQAVDVASSILRNVIDHKISAVKAKDIVVRAFNSRAIPEILVLDGYCPYGEALREIDVKEQVLFVVYGRKDSYALQTVRGSDGEEKKKLPKAWAGKRDEELAEVTGVKDAVFCHTGRFLAVAGSAKGIMKMARLALEEPEEAAQGGIFQFIKGIFTRK